MKKIGGEIFSVSEKNFSESEKIFSGSEKNSIVILNIDFYKKVNKFWKIFEKN